MSRSSDVAETTEQAIQAEKDRRVELYRERLEQARHAVGRSCDKRRLDPVQVSITDERFVEAATQAEKKPARENRKIGAKSPRNRPETEEPTRPQVGATSAAHEPEKTGELLQVAEFEEPLIHGFHGEVRHEGSSGHVLLLALRAVPIALRTSDLQKIVEEFCPGHHQSLTSVQLKSLRDRGLVYSPATGWWKAGPKADPRRIEAVDLKALAYRLRLQSIDKMTRSNPQARRGWRDLCDAATIIDGLACASGSGDRSFIEAIRKWADTSPDEEKN